MFVLATPVSTFCSSSAQCAKGSICLQSGSQNGACVQVLGMGDACSPFREIAPLTPICDSGLQCTVLFRSKSNLPGLCLPKTIAGRAQINQQCAGIGGLKCPDGLQCLTPNGWADAFGVCVMF